MSTVTDNVLKCMSCIFCGEQALRVEARYIYGTPSGYVVRCDDCGFRGSVHGTVSDAVLQYTEMHDKIFEVIQ